MKQTLLSILIMIGLGLGLTKAQDPITFSNDEGTELGDTVTIWIDPLLVQAHEYDISVHNNTSNGMNIKIAREVINELTDLQFSFCWGTACFDPTVDTSANYQFVPANGQTGETENLLADFYPKEKIGTAIVKYTAYNMDMTEAQATVVLKYWASPEAINEDVMKGGSISDVYPNPASNNVSFDYQLTSKVNSAKIKIFNVLGSTVKEADIVGKDGKLSVNVSDLENGVYFYSVIINGEIYTTKKLIVRK